MGLRITEDVLYYAEDNQWKPLPVIKGEPGVNGKNGEKGEPGDDAYTVWLKNKELYPDPEKIHWQEYITEVSRVPVPGGSRVVKEGNEYVAYTPKVQGGATPGLPATNANFVPYDGTTASCDRIVIPNGSGSTASNINYQSLTPSSNDKINPILFAAETMNNGSLVSKIGYMQSPSNSNTLADVGYNPTGLSFAFGNRSTATNKSRTGANRSVTLLMYSNIGTGPSNAYQGSKGIAALKISQGGGHLYIGGETTADCARGYTIIKAGLAPYTGQVIDMTTGTLAERDAANAVLIRRKGYKNTTTTDYRNVDSGHVEHIKVPFKITPARSFTQGRTYYPGTPSQVYDVKTIEGLTTTWDYIASSNSGHSYDVIIQTNNKFNNPHIQYSVLGEEMAYTTPFADHFNIWGVRYDNSRGQLHFSISCKKSKSNFSNDYPKYDKYPVYVYIDFMLFTSDYK